MTRITIKEVRERAGESASGREKKSGEDTVSQWELKITFLVRD